MNAGDNHNSSINHNPWKTSQPRGSSRNRKEPQSHTKAQHWRGMYLENNRRLLHPPSPSSHQTALSEDIYDAKDVSAASSPEPTHQLRADLMTSLLPLHVHGSPFQPCGVSTLKECQDLVGKLRKTNSLQSQEAVPRCILSRKKISPKAYILAKAHGRNITSSCTDEVVMFPKIPLKSLPKKLHREVERVILPALKHSRTTSVTDWQRTRAMQNSCLKTLALLKRHHSNNTAPCDTLYPKNN